MTDAIKTLISVIRVMAYTEDNAPDMPAQTRLYRMCSVLLGTMPGNRAGSLVLKQLMCKFPDDEPNMRDLLKVIDGGVKAAGDAP